MAHTTRVALISPCVEAPGGTYLAQSQDVVVHYDPILYKVTNDVISPCKPKSSAHIQFDAIIATADARAPEHWGIVGT